MASKRPINIDNIVRDCSKGICLRSITLIGKNQTIHLIRLLHWLTLLKFASDRICQLLTQKKGPTAASIRVDCGGQRDVCDPWSQLIAANQKFWSRISDSELQRDQIKWIQCATKTNGSLQVQLLNFKPLVLSSLSLQLKQSSSYQTSYQTSTWSELTARQTLHCMTTSPGIFIGDSSILWKELPS